MGNGGICRHAAGGRETSDRGLRVTGVGDVHVGGSLRKESNWGAGATQKEGHGYGRLTMGGQYDGVGK